MPNTEKEKKIRICINCFNCKQKDKFLYCKEEYFNPTIYKIAQLYTPQDHDCIDYISMDD